MVLSCCWAWRGLSHHALAGPRWDWGSERPCRHLLESCEGPQGGLWLQAPMIPATLCLLALREQIHVTFRCNVWENLRRNCHKWKNSLIIINCEVPYCKTEFAAVTNTEVRLYGTAELNSLINYTVYYTVYMCHHYFNILKLTAIYWPMIGPILSLLLNWWLDLSSPGTMAGGGAGDIFLRPKEPRRCRVSPPSLPVVCVL